jgi:pyrroloquinoline quinone biosynthesis protein B
MKIMVLQGGAPPRRRRSTVAGTADRGVTAIGSNDAWVLVNMSPAVAHQLDTDTRLPAGLVDAELRTVLLTDAQVDHAGGLLSLRGGAPIDLYATPAVFEDLTTALPILPVLVHYCGVYWHPIPVAGDTQVASFRIQTMPDLEFTALDTPASPPAHASSENQVRVGNAIVLTVRDLRTEQTVFCAPGAGSIGAEQFDRMRAADCLMVDMPVKPQSSEDERSPRWLDVLRSMPARHKVVFPASPATEAQRALARSGIALAHDRWELDL